MVVLTKVSTPEISQRDRHDAVETHCIEDAHRLAASEIIRAPDWWAPPSAHDHRVPVA
jgi:hypothetical protein